MAHTIIKLPAPKLTGDISVEEALQKRRSVRDYRPESLEVSEVAQLLWAAQGITDAEGSRTAPSAGAIHALELYLVAGEVNGIPAGIYRYDPRRHVLSSVVEGDQRMELRRVCLDQPCLGSAAIVLAIVAVEARITKKYGKRGITYVHLEAGHAAQNVHLQAVALKLGSAPVGAFDDVKVREVLRLGDEEWPLYLVPVGRT